MTRRPVLIANSSGFYGDRDTAAREMVDGGPIDVLTGDYLAELTMLILWKARRKDPDAGYARTALGHLEQVLGTCLDRGIKIVTNAGGLNPAAFARRAGELAEKLGLHPRIAYVTGDDLLPRLDELRAAGHPLANMDTGQPLAAVAAEPATANAYLGGWGIAAALDGGADIVICPRVTDASLVTGPAAWWHGWARDDFDALAGAVVAGHVIECGPQATGGNYSFLGEITDRRYPGFPIAEVAHDGSSVITKHPGTGGLVSVGTVTAQLLYEIGGPEYLGPDVVSHFDSIELEQVGTDRVRVSGVRGTPPPSYVKVGINTLGGYRNSMSFVLCGLDIEAKASLVREQLESSVGSDGLTWRLARTDHPDADTEQAASALLTVHIEDGDAARAGRAFSQAAVELALASYPGCTLTTQPGEASPYGVFTSEYIGQSAVDHVAVAPDGRRIPIPAPTEFAGQLWVGSISGGFPLPNGSTKRAPLGTVVGARSGDKGGDANLGVWARTDAGWAWLNAFLSVDRLKELLPECAPLKVQRVMLPNLRALNFVIEGLLGRGVAASTRFDPQAKALGEWLRSRLVDIPEALL